MTFAISSGLPSLPIGMPSAIRSAKPGSCSAGAISGVSIAPGQMQLARMPWRAYSMATTRVRLMTPALAALYAAMP